MSPTILRLGNVKLKIMTHDHKPAHVHAIGPDAELRVNLKTFEVMSCHGFSEVAVSRLVRFIIEHKETLLEAWNEYHEEENE